MTAQILILTPRQATPPIVVTPRGPSGKVQQALARNPLAAIEAVIGTTGAQGPQGISSAPTRIDAPLAATWILPHSLSRVPIVEVYLASGERVLSDTVASATTITITFSQPQQGFVLAI